MKENKFIWIYPKFWDAPAKPLPKFLHKKILINII